MSYHARDPRPRSYYDGPARAPYQEDVRVAERERESRVPAFMREEHRRSDAGPLVLRQRDVETMERPRRRSPSPVRIRDMRVMERARSATPPRRDVVEDDVRIRRVERERVRSPSRGPPERVRSSFVERDLEYDEPVDREHIRIVRRERSPSLSDSPTPPPSPPKVIRGPTVEREVITHYRDIDHGIVAVQPPPPPRTRERDEIDIYTSRHATEVDIHKRSRSRARSQSRERLPYYQPAPPVYDDEVLVHSDRNHLHVDIEERRRRAHSAAPPAEHHQHHRRPQRHHHTWDEGEYMTSRIDARGRPGEAWHGATRDWSIVDVPPGTERVRMDGAGGGAAEVTWQKYNGVRRSRFVPERDEASSSSMASEPREADTRLSVQIYDREMDVERTERRVRPRRSEMWTEITKDLVVREAIEQMGYECEETEYFFYVMRYLRYEDVLALVQLSDAIRRARKDRVREIEWERDGWDEHRHYHVHRGHDRHRRHGRDTERIVERDVVYDRRYH